MYHYRSLRKRIQIERLLIRGIRAFYRPKFYRPLFVVAYLLSLVACTSGSDSNDSGIPSEPLQLVDGTFAAETDEEGQVEIAVTMPTASNAVHFVVSTTASRIKIVRVRDPQGKVLFGEANPRDQKSSEAYKFQPSPVSVTIPFVPEQVGTFPPGDYIIRAQVQGQNNSEPIAGVPVSIKAVMKEDDNSESGVVQINAFIVGAIIGSNDSRDAIDSALEECQGLAGGAGISLNIQQIELPSAPDILPDPYLGDAFYLTAARRVESGVNVFFAVDAEGLGGQEHNIAKAPAVPGPAVPSPRSGIAVSIAVAAGGDGLFDSTGENADYYTGDETRILSEDVCHEIFNYMGLVNSVTFQGGLVVSSDTLDSEKCFTYQSCENNKGANGNVMFPFPIDDPDGGRNSGTLVRDRISSGQSTVLNASVFTN